jgi:hypothetical protein
MLFLPPEGGNLAVQDLDRPPLGHKRDRTSALANRNTRLADRSHSLPRSGRPRQYVAALGFRVIAGTITGGAVHQPT